MDDAGQPVTMYVSHHIVILHLLFTDSWASQVLNRDETRNNASFLRVNAVVEWVANLNDCVVDRVPHCDIGLQSFHEGTLVRRTETRDFWAARDRPITVSSS